MPHQIEDWLWRPSWLYIGLSAVHSRRASPRCTAAPCFEIYFGDVGGLLEHRDILQNSSETAMHPLVLFWLDPDHQAASKDACIVTAKFAIIFTDDSSRARRLWIPMTEEYGTARRTSSFSSYSVSLAVVLVTRDKCLFNFHTASIGMQFIAWGPDKASELCNWMPYSVFFTSYVRKSTCAKTNYIVLCMTKSKNIIYVTYAIST